MSEITPIHCPHCGLGNSMVEAYQDDYGYWKVGCGACGSHSGALHPNHKPEAKRLVIESWNRRPDEVRLRTALSEAEQRARREAMEEAAKTIEEGFDRGIASKHDMCVHKKFEWEDCESCAANAIRALIPSEPHDAEGRE